jgi:hypothetical protein
LVQVAQMDRSAGQKLQARVAQQVNQQLQRGM